MMILGVAYVLALLVGACIGAAVLLVALALIAFRATRIVGLLTLAGAVAGSVAVVLAFFVLALVLPGHPGRIGAEMWTLWSLTGAAIGGVPAFLVSGAGKVIVAWIQSRKRQIAALRDSTSAIDKYEQRRVSWPAGKS